MEDPVPPELVVSAVFHTLDDVLASVAQVQPAHKAVQRQRQEDIEGLMRLIKQDLKIGIYVVRGTFYSYKEIVSVSFWTNCNGDNVTKLLHTTLAQ